MAPRKFGKTNKRSPIFTLHLYYLNRLYEVPNKAVVRGKSQKIISKHRGMFIPDSRVKAKLYTPSTLNIVLIQWHTHLNVCAVK